MVIIPHMLAGATIGAHSPNVWAAFCFGLLSHYLLDSLPHWEYLDSLKVSKFSQLIKIFIDFIIGSIIIVFLFLSSSFNIIIISGIIGALLPDFIEFLYVNFKIKLFRPLSIFHHKIHYYKKVSFLKGSISQTIIVIISVILLYWG
ncbi:hypothetical protein KKH96_03125 [Patescibacteria group bacterium]|nr:hypothetical protein [Patescibacteria group bacterium]